MKTLIIAFLCLVGTSSFLFSQKYNSVVTPSYSKENKSFHPDFTVLPIPPPSVEVFINEETTPHDNKKTVSALYKLRFKVLADEQFAQNAPNDANYRINAIEVSLARGKTLVGKTLKSTASEIDLSEMSKLMISGDRVIIEIKGIERINAKGEIEPVNGRMHYIFTIAIQ
jgi:hypothetical protein